MEDPPSVALNSSRQEVSKPSNVTACHFCGANEFLPQATAYMEDFAVTLKRAHGRMGSPSRAHMPWT